MTALSAFPCRTRRNAAGSVLVEALVALVLIAIAGLIVATASVVGLRATRRAATLTNVTALAGRELALAANGAATITSDAGTITVPGNTTPFDRTVDVDRTGSTVGITVRIEGGRPVERVTLATRVLVTP
ncbi:MAG: hypothetical protein ABI080_12270 [Candidatus Binatia bacterium]